MTGNKKILLLDGATGSELDRRGVDVSLPLWSARALLEAEDILMEIHRDYLKAGADAITTNTFRTHRRSLEKAGLGEKAKELTCRAVEIAREARDEINPDALVLGSVSPLEDCYEPELAPPFDICKQEHAEIINWLVDAGVDMLLIETMNSISEAKAAIECAMDVMSGRFIASFCLKGDGEAGELLSGESLKSLLPELNSAFAVGINCVSADSIHHHIKWLRNSLPPDVKIAAYANVDRPDSEKGWINTDAMEPDSYANYAMNWIDSGATIIGGCCGTTPVTIRAIRSRLNCLSETPI